jgi:hypothetical protein
MRTRPSRWPRVAGNGRRLGEQDFQLNALDSTQFAAFIGAERSKWSKLVKDLRIEPK